MKKKSYTERKGGPMPDDFYIFRTNGKAKKLNGDYYIHMEITKSLFSQRSDFEFASYTCSD